MKPRWRKRGNANQPDDAGGDTASDAADSLLDDEGEVRRKGKIAKASAFVSGLWRKNEGHATEVGATSADEEAEHDEQRFANTWMASLFSRVGATGEVPQKMDAPSSSNEVAAEIPTDSEVAATKSRLADAFSSAIRAISDDSERDEVIRWFVDARDVLDSGRSRTDIAKELYSLFDSRRIGRLIGSMATTTVRNYKGANLPLTMKVALPVTALGLVIFGLQGAGLAMFGGAIGLPVVVLLFLGTAGVTAIIESFVKDASTLKPTTRLVVMLIALEQARRLKKELADALRRDVVLPRKAKVSGDEVMLLAELRDMDPFDFERHVMWLFEQREGQPAAVTPKTGDKGFDGYVAHPDGLIVVQCKRYSDTNPVGRPEVQQFKGVIEEQGAARGYLVTTGRFTRDANESAELSERLYLVDGEELSRWHGGVANQ